MVAVPLTATFATGGTWSWTCPAGVTSVTVACTGAGGGGGGAGTSSGDQGGGGGGGEAAAEPSVSVTAGLPYQVVVGAGGAGGSKGGNGSAGGNTSFTGDAGLTVTAHGGQGAPSGTPTAAGPGAAGGTGSSNSVSAAGGAGDDGTPGTSGGGGGGAAGTSSTTGFPGNPGNGSTAGGASLGTWPGGAGGNGGTSTFGANGNGPGGGGGGGESAGTFEAGGTGADGQVVITWTMNDPVTLTADTVGSVTKFQAPLGVTSVTAQAWGAGGGGFNSSGNAPGSTYLIGATIGDHVYGTNTAAAITQFNTYTGLTWANNVTKIYLEPEATWPTSVDSQTAARISAGCKLVICMKPSRAAAVSGGSALTAERTNMANYIQMIQGATSILPDVVLWQEPNGKDSSGPFFANAGVYQTYVNAYGPVARNPTTYVTSGSATACPIAYCPLMGTGTPWDPVAGYPGDTYTDKIIADFYGTAYTHGVRLDSAGIFAASLTSVADGHTSGPIPLGLGEWNAAAGGGSVTNDQWDTYVSYLISVFSARASAGKPVGDLIFWMGNNAIGVTINLITSTTDFKIPGSGNTGTSPTGLKPFASALAPGAASGGAGGGGGEYAAESALAISGLSSYTIAVGEGGSGGSGGNTTIAGNSVTVTAHGGSIATANGTGGAGGTGSSNTTHNNGGAGGAGGTGGGGGGGGSGGTSAAGNAGSAGTATAGGSGGAAVTGGGPGGKGGGTSGNGSPPMSGPGGGGGARGGSGTTNGAGYDGQITLSSFTVGVGCAGGLALAPLAFAGTGSGGAAGGSFALAPLAESGTAAVCDFTLVQIGPALQASGGPLTLTNPSTAGTNLVAKLVSSGTSAMSLPTGWVNAASQNSGGGAGRSELWFLPGNMNPGGISSVTVTGGTLVRGNLAEWSSPGSIMALDGSVGTASGTTPVTSFSVSTPGSAMTADLLVGLFEDQFSSAPSSAWSNLTSGWTTEKSQATVTDNWRSVYMIPGATSGVQTVTSNFGTSTNQTGWSAIIAAFNAVPLNSATGSLTLAPLALGGTATSAVTGGTVPCVGGYALAPLGFQSPSQAVTFPQQPLPVMVEILVNGVWTDITSYVYTRDGINITGRGRPDEASTAQPTQVTLTLNNNDQSFSPGVSTSQFYPFLVRNTQLRISVVSAVTPLGANYTGYRFWGQIPAWPPQWITSGTDVYVSITACGVLQQLSQSKFSASPLTRYYYNQANAAILSSGGVGTGTLPYTLSGGAPAAYWPCEDGNQSGSFASGIPGGSPMTWTGTPSLAADSSIPGSGPFAQLSGSVWTGTPGAFTAGGVTFATPGTYLWTCPGGVASVKAECWGGGGGGGDGQLGTSGGGGEYAAEPSVSVTPGKTYTVVVGAGGTGGAGTFTSSGVRGMNGKQSTFTGDTLTVKAHGGQGGTASGGNAGTGSTNTTHHDGGGGRNGPTSGHGGSGGGGSGGSSSAGNAGNRASSNSGAGGAMAVTGGGPGGSGGNGGSTKPAAGSIPSPGPGGGGGGGGFNTNNNFGLAGGSGYAGQVQLTFGMSSIPPANVVRAIVDIPSGGGTDQANLLSFTTSGDVANAQLSYHTASGGSLQFAGHTGGGATLFDSGVKSFGANGQPMLVSCELTASAGFPGAGGTVNWKLTAITPGAATAVATYKGSFTGNLGLGSVTQVSVNNTVGHTDNGSTGVGHVAVQYAVDPILNLSPALNAYKGELAATRFQRLCGEQNFPAELTGNVTDTPQMGPQPVGLLVELLQDCENADLGQMYELRDSFGMGYRTRVSLQNQQIGVTLNYAAGQVSPPLTPTDDELLVRNDIIATRASGSTTFGTSYEAIQSTGTLSVLDPPNGVGLYQYPVSVNLFTDIQLVGFATWLLILGTVDEFRYPVITADLRRAANADGTFGNLADLDIGDLLVVTNPPAWLPTGPVNQLCFGFTETINAFEWVIAVNAVPADPYLAPTASGGGFSAFPTW